MPTHQLHPINITSLAESETILSGITQLAINTGTTVLRESASAN